MKATKLKKMEFIYTYNNESLTNVSIYLDETKMGLLLNVHVKLLKDFPVVLVRFTTEKSNSLTDGNFEKTFEYAFNACKLRQAAAKNFIFKRFLELMEEKANIPLKCPFKKVCMTVTNQFKSNLKFIFQ